MEAYKINVRVRRGLIFLGAMIAFLLPSFSISNLLPIAYSSEQNLHVIEGRMKEGDTFSHSLLRKRIPLQWVRLILSKLKPYIDFRRMKGGDFQFIADEKGELVKFTFEAGPIEIYELEKDPNGEYVANMWLKGKRFPSKPIWSKSVEKSAILLPMP